MNDSTTQIVWAAPFFRQNYCLHVILLLGQTIGPLLQTLTQYLKRRCLTAFGPDIVSLGQYLLDVASNTVLATKKGGGGQISTPDTTSHHTGKGIFSLNVEGFQRSNPLQCIYKRSLGQTRNHSTKHILYTVLFF